MGLREAMASTSSYEQNTELAEHVLSTSASESQAVYPSAEWFIWDSQKLFALNTHFQSNTTARTVTLESVRETLNGTEELSGFSYQQVHDFHAVWMRFVTVFNSSRHEPKIASRVVAHLSEIPSPVSYEKFSGHVKRDAAHAANS